MSRGVLYADQSSLDAASVESHANTIWEYGRLLFLIKLANVGKDNEKKNLIKKIIAAVVGIDDCQYFS